MYLADRFRDALKDGGIALFVGVGAEQLPVEYRKHPRVTCWDSDSPQLGRSAGKGRLELPTRVRVVVMSKFTSHAALDKVQKATKRANALFMGKLTGTGEMARLLREAFPVPAPPPKEIPMQTETIVSPPNDTPWLPGASGLNDVPEGDATFTTMSEAIRHYARRELNAPLPHGRKRATPLPHAFYEALSAKLQGHGFTCTPTSVVGLFSMQRAKLRQRELAQQEEPAAAAPELAVEALAAPVVAAMPAEPLPPDLDALVQMAADLDLRGLQCVDLADQLRRLVAEQRGLRATQTKYDALRAILSDGQTAP